MRPSVVALTLIVALGACRAGLAGTPAPAPVDCSLPWTSEAQVSGCASADYDVAGGAGQSTLDIVVASQDPATIAAAMAHAWQSLDRDAQAVVRARSGPTVDGDGYDRGVLSAPGRRGDPLVFEICTAWDEGADPGQLCSDRMVFAIPLEG